MIFNQINLKLSNTKLSRIFLSKRHLSFVFSFKKTVVLQ